MRTQYEAARAEQIEIECKLSQGGARICRGNFGRAWKGIFPQKAAEELAYLTGCSVRTASYQLSGEHAPSGKSLAVLVNLCAA